jgi:hypothetical protein
MIEKYLNNRFITLYLIPFLIGSFTILSFEPFNFTFINFIVFPLLFFLLVYINKKSKSIYRKKPYKKNFFSFGLAFGFGFYICGITWITNSLTFDENFKILIPFALILIPLFLSLFSALTTLLVGPYLNFNFSSLLIFSVGFSFSDFVRAKILTGFPWNLWAYSTSWMNDILQIVNPIGLYSYNLLVINFFVLPIIIFFKISLFKKIFSFTSAILIILSLYLYGNYEINKNTQFLDRNNKKVYVKIISPNFDLEYGLNQQTIKNRFNKLIKYSEPNKDKRTLFIWAERGFSGL